MAVNGCDERALRGSNPRPHGCDTSGPLSQATGSYRLPAIEQGDSLCTKWLLSYTCTERCIHGLMVEKKMGQPAAKQGDKITATDMHLIQPPGPVSPVLVPHDFSGTINGDVSSDVLI